MTSDLARVNRRRVVQVLVAGLVTAPRVTRAQPAGKTSRIGVLSLGSAESTRPWIAAFRGGLRALGYVEGENIILEQRYAAGQVDRLAGLAEELVRLEVDVLVAAPAGAALAAKKVTRTVPIVFMGEPDPVGTGLVAGLARPGGNATGLADAHADLVPKRLELLKQIAPSASRIGVLWNPSNRSTAPQLKTVQAAAPALGLTVFPLGVQGPGRDDVDRAFATIRRDRLGALLVFGDSTLGTQRNRIAELAIGHRLPASGTHRAWAEAGLLMSYGTDFGAMFRHGAALVDKILKGAQPADVPVEQPTTFELVVNLKTARVLGLTIPSTVMARADQVIE